MPARLPTKTKGAVAPLLLMALNNAQVGVVVKAQDGTYLYASGLPDYFPQIDVEGATDEVLFEGHWLELIRAAQAKVLETGERVVVELSRTTSSQYSACECTVQRYEIDDAVLAILITFVDLTAERKREDTLKALLRELSHRSKNLLAIVQSIAAQTARNTDDLDAFLVKFRGRLAALSSAQDLVTDSNWRGAMFKKLAENQFLRYVEGDDQRVTLRSKDVLLSPNGATHIGLALHELITNSVAFGALSNRAGRLALTCRPIGGDEFEIRWEEETGYTEYPRTADQGGSSGGKRFGSTVLERVVPAALEGNAHYEIAPHHVSYHLRFRSS